MNVGELKKLLENYPDDMEIVNGRYSDYAIIQPNEFSIIQGVAKDGWVMRSHQTMSAENKAKEKSYLYIYTAANGSKHVIEISLGGIFTWPLNTRPVAAGASA